MPLWCTLYNQNLFWYCFIGCRSTLVAFHQFSSQPTPTVTIPTYPVGLLKSQGSPKRYPCTPTSFLVPPRVFFKKVNEARWHSYPIALLIGHWKSEWLNIFKNNMLFQWQHPPQGQCDSPLLQCIFKLLLLSSMLGLLLGALCSSASCGGHFVVLHTTLCQTPKVPTGAKTLWTPAVVDIMF